MPLGRLLDRCGRLRRSSGAADELASRLVLRSLARRIQAATKRYLARHLYRLLENQEAD